MSPIPAAVVLTPPDSDLDHLRRAVDRSLRDMAPTAVLEVPCPDIATRIDLTEWCLGAGHRIVSPFDHWSIEHLLVRNGGGDRSLGSPR